MARYVKRQCSYCGGRGKTADTGLMSVWRTCIACDGFAFVFVPSHFEKCSDCVGTGRRYVGGRYEERLRCKRCKGTGWAEPVPTHR